MVKKSKEDWTDRFVRSMENFADRMTEWADKVSEKAEKRGYDFSYNTSEINQDGKRIVVKSNKKQITITVNGKEVYKETK